jgi:hypothetical protein
MLNRSKSPLATRVRNDRPFVAWYVRQRRLDRSSAGGGDSASSRTTEGNQDRVTEAGQSRDTQ